MKLCRYGNDRLGVIVGNMVHDVTPAQDEIRASAPYDGWNDAVIAALPQWRSRLEEMASRAPGQPLSSVKLLAPVARPSKLVAAPVNYKKHVEEMMKRTDVVVNNRAAIGDAGMFLKANSSLIGPSESIPVRFPERTTEHEAEIVLIIGKQGSDISRDDALSHVAGYCLGLDMTVRGPEDRSFRKSMDGYSVIGPWLVTADEIADPDALAFRLEVNGEEKQNSNTRDLIFDIRQLIVFASAFYTLYPGDVLFTGTPEGVGRVKAGDVIRIMSEPLGEMSVAVSAHQTGQ